MRDACPQVLRQFLHVDIGDGASQHTAAASTSATTSTSTATPTNSADDAMYGSLASLQDVVFL
jgi:hypothetical protein